MSEATVKLPRTIDEPPYLLFWRGDEMGPFAVLFFIGFVTREIILSLVIAYFFVKVLRKYRDITADGFVLHFLWWKGIFPISTRTCGNPFYHHYVNFRLTGNKE